jgi:hypothetical protein
VGCFAIIQDSSIQKHMCPGAGADLLPLPFPVAATILAELPYVIAQATVFVPIVSGIVTPERRAALAKWPPPVSRPSLGVHMAALLAVMYKSIQYVCM